MVDAATQNGMRSWIEENRDVYNEARKKMADPKFVDQAFKSFKFWLSDLMAFNPAQHSSDMAVYVCAKTQERAMSLLTDIEFIEQYEEEVRRYNEAIKEMEEAEAQLP